MGLSDITKLKIPVRTSLKIHKSIRAIDQAIEDAQAVIGEYIDEFVEKGENGQPLQEGGKFIFLSEEAEESYNEKVAELNKCDAGTFQSIDLAFIDNPDLAVSLRSMILAAPILEHSKITGETKATVRGAIGISRSNDLAEIVNSKFGLSAAYLLARVVWSAQSEDKDFREWLSSKPPKDEIEKELNRTISMPAIPISMLDNVDLPIGLVVDLEEVLIDE